MPPSESRFQIAKTGGAMVAGIYLGHAHVAGGPGWARSYATPLRQVDDLNTETGRTPAGKRPIVE
eukprot:9495751-Pyramimonas_sp.AAC.1